MKKVNFDRIIFANFSLSSQTLKLLYFRRKFCKEIFWFSKYQNYSVLFNFFLGGVTASSKHNCLALSTLQTNLFKRNPKIRRAKFNPFYRYLHAINIFCDITFCHVANHILNSLVLYSKRALVVIFPLRPSFLGIFNHKTDKSA